MEINGTPLPKITVELKYAGNGRPGIIAKKEAVTFIDALTREKKLAPLPPARTRSKGSLLDVVA